MIQDATTSHKNRLTSIFFIVFLSLISLCSFLMRFTENSAGTNEAQLGTGILGRLVSFVVILSWSITMIVLTIKHWKKLNTVSRIMGLSPLFLAPLFFILQFD